MIFSAFQGIGKTTLAKSDLKIIDLESSSFDKNNEGWYKDYVRVAYDLVKQGYIVFVSSHKVVRDYILRTIDDKSNYAMIMYEKNLEVYCLDKLVERFEASPEDSDEAHKNFRAYQRAASDFDPIYNELKFDEQNLGLKVIWLTDKNYNLADIINNYNK